MRSILSAWMILCAPLLTLACDVCGIFLGVQPHDRASTIGLLYRSRVMQGTTQVPLSSNLLAKHGAQLAPGTAYRTVPLTEIVNVAELRADLRLGDRFFLLAALPLTNTYRGVNGYRQLDAYGPGDPFAMLRYQVVNTRAYQERSYVHRLLVGGGLKAPLGSYDMRIGDELASLDIQLGTGSWDALLGLEYTVRRGRVSAGITSLARLNGTNPRGEQLGHALSTTVECLHRFGNDTLSVAPVIGAYIERMGRDRIDGTPDPHTGGTTLLTHAGLRTWWGRFAFSAYYQHAVAHRLGLTMTPTRHRLVVGLTYRINTPNR